MNTLNIQLNFNRVQRGIVFLDKQKPGWHCDINVDKIDMSHSDSCILGQLFGNYEDGLDELELEHDEAVNYGLTIDEQDEQDECEDWGDDWEDEVIIHNNNENSESSESLFLSLGREWKRQLGDA